MFYSSSTYTTNPNSFFIFCLPLICLFYLIATAVVIKQSVYCHTISIPTYSLSTFHFQDGRLSCLFCLQSKGNICLHHHLDSMATMFCLTPWQHEDPSFSFPPPSLHCTPFFLPPPLQTSKHHFMFFFTRHVYFSPGLHKSISSHDRLLILCYTLITYSYANTFAICLQNQSKATALETLQTGRDTIE